ncbi:MAG: PD40 domain-containing protein [Bdellovibrionales bacterium]|nr:PD40 domain-containing protein [Bdellovibrionales bacterium]
MKIRIGNSPALRRLALPQSALRQSALLLKLASPLLLLLTSAEAQVDVLITPPDSDFTIAAPPLCSTSSGELAAATLAAKTVATDMLVTGKYRAQGPDAHPTPLGDCSAADGGPFTADLNGRGINILVSGKTRFADDRGRLAVFDFYAYDVAQAKAVIGKRYEGRSDEAPNFAHQFANELYAYLTGEAGPFGSKIVFTANTGGVRELYALRLGTAEATQLTEEKGQATAPSWSPSGDKIIFTLQKKSATDLFTIPSAGGRAQRITFLPGSEKRPRISRDGKQILSSVEISGAESLALFNFRGRLMEKLTESDANDIDPAWSPDGSHIAFASNRDGRWTIYRLAANGGDARPLVQKKGSDCRSPSWSPDGKLLAVSCTVGSEHQLFLQNLASNELTQLTFKGDNTAPSFSPDGRFLVYRTVAAGRSDGDIAIFSLPALRTTLVLQTPTDDDDPSWAP